MPPSDCPTLNENVIHIVDGETGTYKTSKAQELGGNVTWCETGGHSDTGPDDVKITSTLKAPILDCMGRNDTKAAGMTAFGKYSNLQVLRLIVSACAKYGTQHLASYQLHIRASVRMLDEFRKPLDDVYKFLQGNMGHLVVLVVNCNHPSEMTGINELLKTYTSKNGPPTAVPFYPPHHFVSPAIIETGRYIHFQAQDYHGNWQKLEAFLPKLDPFKFVFSEEHCLTCNQHGDRRLLGPCHSGPIQSEHGGTRQVHRHRGNLTSQHGRIVRDEFTAGGIIHRLAGTLNPWLVAASLGLDLLTQDICEDCRQPPSADKCHVTYACCGAVSGSEGCQEFQQCISCNEAISETEGCQLRCLACNRNPHDPESGCDHFNKVAHNIAGPQA